MKSPSVSSWLGRVLKSTTLASIHVTARCRVGGHSAHCGRKSHSLGIRVGIALRMRASFCVVHCQNCGPSHSMRRCCFVHATITTLISRRHSYVVETNIGGIDDLYYLISFSFRPFRYRSAVNVLPHGVPVCSWPYFVDAHILYTCFTSTYVVQSIV